MTDAALSAVAERRYVMIRRNAALSIMVAMLAAAPGCVMEPPRPPPRLTGDPVTDGRALRDAAPDKDRVLWDYRTAAAAIRAGKFADAREMLDEAIARQGGIVGNSDEAARRARTLFVSEDTKNYIGEPYERVMAYYYRGLLYWRDGELDNARACFRSAQLVDSDAEVAANKADYVLLDYLDGLASAKLASDGSDAYARAEKLAKHDLPPYDPAANVMLFVEFGHGPQKVVGGEYGEQLRFRTTDSTIRSAMLTVGDQTVHFTPWDNLNFQATTRGGRVMDYILGRKAVFKGGADAVGDVALAGAEVAAANIYKPKELTPEEKKAKEDAKAKEEEKAKEDAKAWEEARRKDPRNPPPPPPKKDPPKEEKPELVKDQGAENTAIILGVVGIFSKIAAAAAAPNADTRTWDNLPQYLSFASIKLPAGDYPAKLEFFDANGQKADALTREFTLSVGNPENDTVAILSELKR